MAAHSKVRTKTLIKLYRKYGNVLQVTKHTSISYMAVRVRLIKAGIIKGKTFVDYRSGK